jgi:hypothetical protein
MTKILVPLDLKFGNRHTRFYAFFKLIAFKSVLFEFDYISASLEPNYTNLKKKKTGKIGEKYCVMSMCSDSFGEILFETKMCAGLYTDPVV